MYRILDHGVEQADGPIFLQAVLVSLAITVISLAVFLAIRRRGHRSP